MKSVKYGLLGLALMAFVPTFAQEEVEEEGAIGWTPVAVGIATPIQLPWGINKWDVFGLDLNLLYSDAPKMYGLDLGGLATTTRDEAMGLIVGGFANLGFKDVYGWRATLGLNYSDKVSTLYGLDTGLCAYNKQFVGADVSFLFNFTTEEFWGLQMAGIFNYAEKVHGMQFALICNIAKELEGCQLSLVNIASDCTAGFQIGLVNVIQTNVVPVLPIVNGYF